MNLHDFVEHINKQRKAGGWYSFVGVVETCRVQLKGHGTWLQIFRVDGINQPNPMEMKVKQFLDALERPFMISYDETYATVTHASAEHGDFADRGHILHNGTMSYEQMIDTLDGTEPSVSPLRDDEPYVFFTRYNYREDFETGEREERSYHPNNEYSRRRMIQAWKYANQ